MPTPRKKAARPNAAHTAAPSTPDTVEAVVTGEFTGPDAPNGARVGDRLSLTPDRLAFLHARHLADKA